MNPIRPKIINILLHPALLTLPVALFVIALIPDLFSKYIVEKIDERIYKSSDFIHYKDLDKDGNSEYFISGTSNNRPFLTLFDLNGIIDQWNPGGQCTYNKLSVITCDGDQNGTDEIYLFTISNDSLLLHGIDMRFKSQYTLKNKYLIAVNSHHPPEDVTIIPKAIDLNNDGFPDLLMIVNAGFGLYPRRMLAYDLRNDSIWMSQDFGAFLNDFSLSDLDRDGKPEISICNYASANNSDTISRMHDWSAYEIILNEKLQLLTPVREIKGSFAGISRTFVHKNNEPFLLQRVDYKNDNKSNILQISLLDKHLNIQASRKYPVSNPPAQHFIVMASKTTDQIVNVNQNGDLTLLDYNLETMKTINSHSHLRFGLPIPFDIDRDGEDELIAAGEGLSDFFVLDASLHHSAVFQTASVNATPIFNHISKSDVNGLFSMKLNEFFYILRYSPNPNYYWRFPVYFLVYVLVFGFVMLTRQLQRIQLRRKYETERLITELKLVSLQNQMNPHFIFNVLNTIGSVILQKKTDTGYDLLMKFSRMIRNLLNSSDSIYCSLKDELEFATNFLELQLARTNQAFTFNISMNEDIDPERFVPKMVIQTHVENALKHAIIPLKTRQGSISISIGHTESQLEISITDNGIGRKQAAEHPVYSTGKGIAILNQTFQLLNQRNKRSITQTIIDLKDEAGKAAGTAVHIIIPDDFIFVNTK